MRLQELTVLLLAACGGRQDAGDAGLDGSTEACAACLDAGAGVPDLGTPAYDAWLSDMLASSTPYGPRRYGGCAANSRCGLVAVRFAEGKDCSELYVFDRATHAWVASLGGCVFPRCVAMAAVCIAPDCFPTLTNPNVFDMPTDECPAPKDAGND